MESLGQFQPLLVLGYNVSPPYPRRNTGHARQFQDAVCRAASAVAFHHDASVLGEDSKAVVASFLRNNLYGSPLAILCLYARHLSHVVAEHVKGLSDHWLNLVGNTIRDWIRPVKPYYVCGMSTECHGPCYSQDAYYFLHWCLFLKAKVQHISGITKRLP